MTTFQYALRAQSVRALQEIPKSDLHNHAYAGGNREWVARATGRDISPLERPLNSMHEWVDRQFGSVFAGPEGRLKAFEATFVQARYDGVTRLEVGEDAWAITLFDDDAARLTSSLADIHRRLAPDIEWIPQLGMSRHCSVAKLTTWLEPFLELGFYKSVDLSGDELSQPIENFKPLYRMAKDAGLRLKAHAGDVLVFGRGVSEEFFSRFQAKVFSEDELESIRLAGLTDSQS